MSYHMLISILSVSDKDLEMSWVKALAPREGDLKPDDCAECASSRS